MSKSAMVELLPEHASAASGNRAPALPVEGPLVRTVRALEAVQAQASALLILLEHAPRDDAQLTASMNATVARVNDASLALWQFQNIRACEGQA